LRGALQYVKTFNSTNFFRNAFVDDVSDQPAAIVGDQPNLSGTVKKENNEILINLYTLCSLM
jgi:hypothetical protein